MVGIWKKVAVSGLVLSFGAGWIQVQALSCPSKCPLRGLPVRRPLPTRQEQLKSLENGKFDIVIIGGGATGAGCALDAAARGLKTALIEANDFSSGTSSKSTKLVHGGVRTDSASNMQKTFLEYQNPGFSLFLRYLQAAIMKLSYAQFKILKEALYERTTVLEIAPHLTYPLPIILPVYKWWQVPYYWMGVKLYDLVAMGRGLKSSYYLSKKNALQLFPMLKPDNLKGGIVYYDGMMDDARLNLAIALTATKIGASIANHVEAVGLVKRMQNEKEIICGVQVCDKMTNKTWTIETECVINATGPFTDSIRKMDDPNVETICQPSTGIHVILPGYYCPEKMGLLDPDTSDGRIIFFLPWKKHTIAGTTDLPLKEVTRHPQPTEKEVDFILGEIKNYLSCEVDVWCGIRPLVRDPSKPNTASLARNHVIHVSSSNLITIAGGKWTTYRFMAKETIDKAIETCGLQQRCLYLESRTSKLPLDGSETWTPNMYIRLVQNCGVDSKVAKHLGNTYGDQAFYVASLGKPTGKRWPLVGKKIHPDFPYIDAEVRWGVRSEYALTAVDMIARRLRLAFLNVEACREALPEILNIMAEELKWTETEKKDQEQMAIEFLQTEMGQSLNNKTQMPKDLTEEETKTFSNRFKSIDKQKRGTVCFNEIANALQEDSGGEIPQEDFRLILNKFGDPDKGLALEEYLQVIALLKNGIGKQNLQINVTSDKKVEDIFKEKIPVERSGGGP